MNQKLDSINMWCFVRCKVWVLFCLVLSVTMEGTHCFGGHSTDRSPSVQTSFYQGTPSPADSGVMSPMTPLSSWTGSTPEHLTTGFQSSPFPVQTSIDEPHSFPATTSPMSSNEEERHFYNSQNFENFKSSKHYGWQIASLDVVGSFWGQAEISEFELKSWNVRKFK